MMRNDMRERRLLPSFLIVALAVGCTFLAGCAGTHTASRPHDAPELETVLPSEVAGRKLDRWSVRGRNFYRFEKPLSDQDVEAINRDLAQRGLTIDDVTLTVAGRTNLDDPPYLVFALRFGNVPAAELPRELLIEHPEAGAWSDRMISGKLVRVGTATMFSQTVHQRGVPYVYDYGSIRFIVLTDDESWAAGVLRQLP